MNWVYFLHADINLGKLKVANYWVGIVKNGWGFLDHWNLKSGVSRKWFDEKSRLSKWSLHVDSDGIIFGLMANLLCSCT